MCEFCCDICGASEFVTTKYDEWVTHLMTPAHQELAKKKLKPRKRFGWDEDNSFVLFPRGEELPGLHELVDWISKFGVLTQILYNASDRFCVFTLQGYGVAGRETALSISSHSLKGHTLEIKHKASLTPEDWNSLFEDNQNKKAAVFPSNSAVLATAASSSSPGQMKGSITNKNQQSSSSMSDQSSAKSYQDGLSQQMEAVSLNADESSSKKISKKARKKERAAERPPLRINPAVAVPPSSLVTSVEASQSREVSGQKSIQQPDFNFRGGFTPSGRIQHRVSESSDSSYQPESGRSVSSGASTPKRAPAAQQPQPPPPVVVLRRTVVNEKVTQRQNGSTRQHHNFSRHQHQMQQQSHPLSSGHPQMVPMAMNPYNRAPVQPRVFHPHPPVNPNVVLSPAFTSQLTPNISTYLCNPQFPNSRDPYNFHNMPPYPKFFELFQKLPDESYKPEKAILYKQFQALPLGEQLEHFFTALMLPFEEVRLRWQVVLDIMFLLRYQFPRCELYAFGSILTGLGDFMSDVDIYVDLTGESANPTDLSQKKIPSHEAVDIVKKILRKSQCPHSKKNFVKMLIPVKSARVPILKITHATSRINCDLSFENRLSVQNTKLLLFYLNLDTRIFRFMVLIRYWAKFHHLTGSNHIKNYGLTLMVLVYLTQKGYVPSVELLQRLKAEERKRHKSSCNPDEIDGWDASFCDNIPLISQKFKANNFPGSDNNNQAGLPRTLIQMAIEFFDMMANLDFSKVVVCPLLGQILDRSNFQAGSEETLPDTLDRYKNWAVKQPMNRRLNIKTCLCIQDPFVLSFNVGSVTPQGTMLRFQVACAKSIEILKRNSGLASLLDVLVPLPPHIGEKKFMKTYRVEMMSQELRKEIKMTVLGSAGVEETPAPLAVTPQISTFVNLPVHLKSFDKLIDEKGLKQTAKRPRWELFLDYSLVSQFEDTYVAELTRCKLANNRKLNTNIMDNLCTLWYQFTTDFLNEFFEEGLRLVVVDKKEETVEPFLESDSNCVDISAKPLGEEEGKQRKRWKVKPLRKEEEELLLLQVQILGSKTPEQVQKLSQKIAELPSVPGNTRYSVITYRVDYPFWEKRPSLLEKASQELQPSDRIEVPFVPTTRKSKKERGKGKKQKNEDKERDKMNAASKVWTSFNPVHLEAKVSEMIRESGKEKNFSPFTFTILTKLDLSCVNDRPELYFVFEKDPKSKADTEFSRAAQCLERLLADAVLAYQMYRLAEWLDLPKATAAAKPSAVEKVEENEKNTDVSEHHTCESDGGASDKRKKARSQLEEDLLIPSSSSSTSSDDDDDDDTENGNMD